MADHSPPTLLRTAADIVVSTLCNFCVKRAYELELQLEANMFQV